MGVDMLLLDGQSSLIQASVSVHRLNTFRELLREGAMYELGGFDVTRSNNRFKHGDSAVAIRLNKFTNMVEVPAVANLIPTEMFRFRSVDQLMSLANTNVELPRAKVVLAINISPMLVGGELLRHVGSLSLNATSGTHFYFDKEWHKQCLTAESNEGPSEVALLLPWLMEKELLFMIQLRPLLMPVTLERKK
ncbi:hypothetical protein IGI04_034569 [Brassica rapa subsp. trilocularis]|uniref:Uncharacterized protein n=1 Tax=Brassica rapa subsp. trilocularis TaxID=1813537 RepID=A0ABQ7LBZ0_BRACM|nr:hypothetical protein IGI04_034569 [Brassica rapa subsp. trilocularis]